jgi:tetratricopeptide (TPR) repeat protein
VPAWERALKWARHRPAQALAVGVGIAFVLLLAGSGVAYGVITSQQAQRQRDRRESLDACADRADSAEHSARLDTAEGELLAALALLDAETQPGDDEVRRRITERLDRVRARKTELADRRRAAERLGGFERLYPEVQFHAITFIGRDLEAGQAAICRTAAAALAQFDITAADTPDDAVRHLEAYAPHFAPPERDRAAAACCEVLLTWAEAEPPQGALHLLDLAAALGRSQQVSAQRTFRLHRARYLAELGRKDEGRAEQQQADRLEPGSAQELYLAAQDAWRQGKTVKAVGACREVLAQEPNHYWARYLLAMCDLRAGNHVGAVRGLSACLGARPDFVWPRLSLAVAEGGLGDFAAAEKDFELVLKHAGDDPAGRGLVLADRGLMWIQKRNWDAAVSDLNEATRLRPDSAEGYISLAQAHRGRRDYPAAVAAQDRALERRPGDSTLYHTRAQFHELAGDRAAARADYERAIALRLLVPAPQRRPGDEDRLLSDYVELAHLHHKAGEYAPALASCDAALRLRRDYPPAHRQRADTLIQMKDYAGAARELDYYLRNGKPTPEVYRARGLIHAERHEYPEAVEAYGMALRFRPDADALAYRGWAYLKLDQPRLALADFQAALALKKEHGDALCGRGSVRVRLGEIAGAVDDANAALRVEPRNPRLLLRAACIHAQAVAYLDAQWGARAWTAGPATRYQARAVELLADLLRGLPARERRAYWREAIQEEKDLAPISCSAAFLELARTWGR